MKTIYFLGNEIWNARKIRLFWGRQQLVIMGTALATICIWAII